MTTLKICLITFLLTAVYLLSSVCLSNILFYFQSNGSLIKINNHTIGSKLLGQEFKNNIYFHNRPSLNNYKNNISGCSNFPYYSERLKEFIKTSYEDFKLINLNTAPDSNLISESASGVDPHITYNGALCQVNRISNLTDINKKEIISLINKVAKPKVGGLFGEKIVNVLEINIKLRDIYAKKNRAR